MYTENRARSAIVMMRMYSLMYAKSIRPSAKREVQKERSAQRDDQIARPRRAQTCERSELRAMRMCPRSGQIFFNVAPCDCNQKQKSIYMSLF